MSFLRNIPLKLFLNLAIGLGGDVFEGFSIFSSSSRFVQPSGTMLAIFEKGHKRNIYVKLF